MYGTEVDIFHETDHICFCSFLCRHIMVLPWKHKSCTCPLLGLSHRLTAEKGSFLMRELRALLELPDLSKSNCARPVLPGLLDFSSLEEFLLGGFASHGRSELPPDWLLLTQSRWPSLCSHLGQLLGWQ